MSYKNLEIWKLADEQVVEIHQMILNKLPKLEMYEEGKPDKKVIVNPNTKQPATNNQ